MPNIKQALLRESEIGANTNWCPLYKLTATQIRFLCWPISVLFVLAIQSASVNLLPVHPGLGHDAVALHYQDHYRGFRAGVAFAFLALLFNPFYAFGMTAVFLRIPKVNQILIMAQTTSGFAVGLAFMALGFLFGTFTFRHDRDPQLIQLISDTAWLYFTLLIAVLILHNVLIGILIRSDHRERPLLPSWLAWVHWSIPISCIGIWAAHYFQYGPLAWNGGLYFWSPVVGFIVQAVVQLVFFWIAAGELDDE